MSGINIQPITHTVNKNNTKCKRKANLFKKSMELSKLCNQDIIVIIYDKELAKLHHYRSNEKFDLKQASAIIKKKKSSGKKGAIQGEHT